MATAMVVGALAMLGVDGAMAGTCGARGPALPVVLPDGLFTDNSSLTGNDEVSTMFLQMEVAYTESEHLQARTASRVGKSHLSPNRLSGSDVLLTEAHVKGAGIVSHTRRAARAHEVHHAVSTSTTGHSAVPTVIFLAVMALLALVAVIVYRRSLLDSSSLEEPVVEPTTPARGVSHTDDELNRQSPSNQSRERLKRRHTVTIATLKTLYWTIESSNETMSSAMFVVNMFADLCPPGFLPLAYGLKVTGYIPGFVLLVCFYCLCVYTMWAISKSMQITMCKDFASQWKRTVGEGSSWVPVLVVVFVCLGCNLSYSCFFADIFTGVMPALGLRMPRSLCLLGFTVFPTMPLCLLKNLSALSYSSSFALVAVIYTTVVMVVRALDGTYLKGGQYFADLDPKLVPEVPKQHLYGFGLSSLVLLNTLAVAFLSHYNGCKYYRELEAHTPAKLVRCTATAMGISVVLFGVTMVAGFQTFGTNADGVILKNYSEKDLLVNVARVGMGLSIVASFPLMFSGLREAVITLLKIIWPSRATEFDLVSVQDTLSMVLLCIITVIAVIVTDAGLVVGIVGAICGSACIYVVPCTLYAGAIKGFLKSESFYEILLLRALTVLGVVLGVLGAYSSLFL